MKTYFYFPPGGVITRSVYLEVDRDENISNMDSDIGIRACEKIIGHNINDQWTQNMDILFKEHKIKFREVTQIEFRMLAKQATDVTMRI